MHKRFTILAILVGSILLASSNGSLAEDKIKKDRRRLALDTGILAAGVLTLQPAIVGAGLGGLAGDSIRLAVHKNQAKKEQAALANGQPTQVETLIPVPQRPGYYYYPSNPNQLYVDPSQVAESLPAKTAKPSVAMPERITVKVANASKDGRTISYSVDGTQFSVPPGYTQTLAAAPGSVISFETGNGAAIERYTLTEGSFEFRSVENTWRLYNQEAAPSVASGSPRTSPTTGASVPR